MTENCMYAVKPDPSEYSIFNTFECNMELLISYLLCLNVCLSNSGSSDGSSSSPTFSNSSGFPKTTQFSSVLM